MRIRIPGRSEEMYPLAASVSPDYFDVFDIPILAGRSFDTRDTGQAAGLKPIVVSRQFARRFFGNESALGEIVERANGSASERMAVIGVCEDRLTGLAETSAAMNDGSMIYELIEPSARSGFLLVKARGDGRAMVDRLRVLLRDLTGSAALVQTFESSLAGRVTGVRRVETLLLALGVVSLVLAVIGVVGIVSADANQRRKEFAIRLALGAGPWAVRRKIVSSGLRPVPLGVILGLLASWGVLKVVESQRVMPLGSGAGDPGPYLTISIVLLIAALGTLLAVAYPAGRRDPVLALREE